MLPNNKDAKTKYDTCVQTKRTAMFEAAIATPDAKPASEEIDLSLYRTYNTSS